MSSARFSDRREAGRELAHELEQMVSVDPVVIALPRGGVPVGFEVARALDAPLDIGLVRKLGAPMQPELGVGALGEGGEVVLDTESIEQLGISREQIAAIIEREADELERRRRHYRAGNPPLDVAGRDVIIVDDGLATGVTATAAAKVMRQRGARSVILAVPVCPRDVSTSLREELDGLVCLRTPFPFLGVGGAYDDFSQTTDEEVVELLDAARGRVAGDGSDSGGQARGPVTESELVIVPAPGIELGGTLRIPQHAAGLVIFAHGSGSSRLSPRNRAVAERLNAAGIATLLFDLLSDAEAADRANVFDIELLAERLLVAHRAISSRSELAGLPVGYFGASTGAGAALVAAARGGGQIAAVVSRGGRPDLAGTALCEVRAPTLLIVGGADRDVLELNRQAEALIPAASRIAIVPGAGHLFEEPGALEKVFGLASDWFESHFN